MFAPSDLEEHSKSREPVLASLAFDSIPPQHRSLSLIFTPSLQDLSISAITIFAVFSVWISAWYYSNFSKIFLFWDGADYFLDGNLTNIHPYEGLTGAPRNLNVNPLPLHKLLIGLFSIGSPRIGQSFYILGCALLSVYLFRRFLIAY
jgi:hypothetical protein